MENYYNDDFDDMIDSDFFEFDDNVEEPLWDKLIQKIIDGKVIPVIGPEMMTINGTEINKYIVDGIGRKLSMKNSPNSFSELIYAPEYKNTYGNRDRIYYQVNNIFAKKRFAASNQLERLLSIRQFPFVITTSFAPIVEDTMRTIWKDELRVLRFNNNPMENDDIRTGADLRKPTVYYMFGKVCDGVKKYVLTDTDMLDYVSSWLSNDNRARPKNLCNELKDKYILMLGNNFSNWLFRFIWYSMRKPDLGQGMLAYDSVDESLITFLERTETFTKQNTTEVIDQLVSRLEKKLAENEKTKFNKPEDNIDVFISYSRKDIEIASRLYDSLTKQGKRVWYDKHNLTDGGNFMEEIRKAIRTSKFFIPILSHNITAEKDFSHVYRNEWDTAIEVAISMGRTYLIPLAEEGFDFYRAAIPEKMQQHNAIFYNKDDMSVAIDRIIHKMNQD